jgi:hypothetical protein
LILSLQWRCGPRHSTFPATMDSTCLTACHLASSTGTNLNFTLRVRNCLHPFKLHYRDCSFHLLQRTKKVWFEDAQDTVRTIRREEQRKAQPSRSQRVLPPQLVLDGDFIKCSFEEYHTLGEAGVNPSRCSFFEYAASCGSRDYAKRMIAMDGSVIGTSLSQNSNSTRS